MNLKEATETFTDAIIKVGSQEEIIDICDRLSKLRDYAMAVKHSWYQEEANRRSTQHADEVVDATFKAIEELECP